jgi:hypothetical protein
MAIGRLRRLQDRFERTGRGSRSDGGLTAKEPRRSPRRLLSSPTFVSHEPGETAMMRQILLLTADSGDPDPTADAMF